MNLIDIWRQEISVVADKSSWKESYKSAVDKSCVTANMSNISPFIGGSLYNFSGEFLGCDGNKKHDDYVFVGNFTLPLTLSVNILTSSYEFSKEVQNITQMYGLKNKELNIRAVLSAIRAAEAGYDNPPLEYNAWNRGKNFTDKSYIESPNDYKKHPGLLKLSEKDKGSSAAGAYQFLERFYTEKDFSPQSQDKGAITKMKENRVFDIAARGDFASFQKKASNVWTSFTAKKWQNKVLEKCFIMYRGQELSNISMIATPIGQLLKK